MTETAEMQAKPVAWRWRYDQRFAWHIGILELSDGIRNIAEVEPLYSQSDFDAMRAQRDEAIRLLRQVSLALESLTPSGSEYISHSKMLGTFYADADACCRFVKDQKADGHKARIEAVDERRRNADLKAQITKLREALTDLSATGDNLLDCGNAILGAVPGDPESTEAFDMFDAARGTWRLCRLDARTLLSEPSPSNSGDTP